MDAILTGEPLPARRADEMGSASRLVDPGVADAEAMRVARKITVSAPLACGPAVRLCRAARAPTTTRRCAPTQADLLDELMTTEDAEEGARRVRGEAPTRVEGPLMTTTETARRNAARSGRRAAAEQPIDTSAAVFAC